MGGSEGMNVFWFPLLGKEIQIRNRLAEIRSGSKVAPESDIREKQQSARDV